MAVRQISLKTGTPRQAKMGKELGGYGVGKEPPRKIKFGQKYDLTPSTEVKQNGGPSTIFPNAVWREEYRPFLLEL